MSLHPDRIGVCAALTLALCLGPAPGAEEEELVLTIQGDLIGLKQSVGDSIADRDEAMQLVEAYHQLLPPAVLARITTLHDQALALIPDFEVAYAAADSAEITSVMSEIDMRLAAMQKIYARHYTQQVSRLLIAAYQQILPDFGDR